MVEVGAWPVRGSLNIQVGWGVPARRSDAQVSVRPRKKRENSRVGEVPEA